MKTILNTTAAKAILIFTLSIGFQIQQTNAKSPANFSPSRNSKNTSISAPITPKEATFKDGVPESSTLVISFSQLIPKEATFNDASDSAIEITPAFLKKVAPVTPLEADFDDILQETNIAGPLNFTFTSEAEFSEF